MRILLRSVQWLALSLWVGGLVFFAFVLAPTAFSPMVTGQTHSFVVSGAIVGSALRQLHWIGLVCGILFAVALLAQGLRRKLAKAGLLLIVAMLLVTAYSQFSIIPRMESDRIQVGGDIDATAPDNLQHLDFDRLHSLSEKLEGLVLFCGLGLIVVTASAHTIE